MSKQREYLRWTNLNISKQNPYVSFGRMTMDHFSILGRRQLPSVVSLFLRGLFIFDQHVFGVLSQTVRSSQLMVEWRDWTSTNRRKNPFSQFSVRVPFYYIIIITARSSQPGWRFSHCLSMPTREPKRNYCQSAFHITRQNRQKNNVEIFLCLLLIDSN